MRYQVGLLASFSIGFIYFTSSTGCSVDMKDCGSCHTEVFNEWKSSAHANAWKNERFQSLYQSLGKPENCASCHAPDAILFSGITLIPKPRQNDREKGIDCVSCHGGPSGFHGPYEVQHIPHPARQDSVFYGIQLCISCHGQNGEVNPGMDMVMFNQVDSYLKTDLIAQGKDCNSCHSPAVQRYSTDKKDYPLRTTRAHSWLGDKDPEFIKGLLNVEVKKLPDKIFVLLTGSEKVGHALPGGGMKEIVVQILVRKADGTEFMKAEEVVSFARKNRILPGLSQFFIYRMMLSTGEVDVKVWLKQAPGEKIDQASLLAEKTFHLGNSVPFHP